MRWLAHFGWFSRSEMARSWNMVQSELLAHSSYLGSVFDHGSLLIPGSVHDPGSLLNMVQSGFMARSASLV